MSLLGCFLLLVRLRVLRAVVLLLGALRLLYAVVLLVVVPSFSICHCFAFGCVLVYCAFVFSSWLVFVGYAVVLRIGTPSQLLTIAPPLLLPCPLLRRTLSSRCCTLYLCTHSVYPNTLVPYIHYIPQRPHLHYVSLGDTKADFGQLLQDKQSRRLTCSF